MDKKKDEFLSAVWNQIDSAPRETSKPAKISQKKCERKVSYPSSSSVRQTVTNQIVGINAQKRNSYHQRRPDSRKTNSSNSAVSHVVQNKEKDYGQTSTQARQRNQQGHRYPKNGGRYTSDNNEYKPKIFYDKSTKPISFTVLSELITKQPNEILLSISKKDCGFFILIQKDNIRHDMMALVLIALGKSCSADLIKNVSYLINTVCSNIPFLLTSVQLYLVWIRQIPLKTFHYESLSYLTIFLQKFQHTVPSSSSEMISILLPLLKLACEKVLNLHRLYESVMKRLDEINEQNEHFLKKYTPEEVKRESRREKLQLLEPPENYRSIPVLPNIDDIHSPHSFLRPNIVKGKYTHTEHYLDVQYRLLREDYIRPLREGIADYLRLKRLNKPLKSFRDIRVYSNVHIVKQDFVNGGMVHIAEFSTENFEKIKWEYSKRFLSGSLLCFSLDDFQTMLFASVARRIPEELKKGLLLVRFEDISDEVLNLNPLKSFVVLETTAYFEAYRYNLKALHGLNEETLPLKRYIINVEKTINCPGYLHETITYDMRPLLIPLEAKYIKHTMDTEGDVCVEYEFPSGVLNTAKSVPILNDHYWPTESDLNLDHSQYIALKAAVTKEFSIIQGPPGTGKTYIGLRIVQLLLHNINKWWMRDINSLPILVVCFTNHALDQFLEGLMLFTNKIVRIGGRGNEAVAKFQLSNLKHVSVTKHEIPKYISSSMWHKNHELKSLKLDIDKINQSIQKTGSIVLGEIELIKFIPSHQFDSLKSIKNFPAFKEFNLTDDGLIIHDWLGIRSRIGEDNYNSEISEIKDVIVQKVDNHVSIVEEKNDDEDVESIGEGDIEFIEAQRDIDSEEFADVSFDIEAPEKEDFVLPDNSGWQMQGGKKGRMKYIKNSLKNSVPFEESEVIKIRNVWNLNLPKRWQLYKFWLQKFITEKNNECLTLQLQFKARFQEVCEMRTEEDIFILKRAHIVGMTTTGAAKYRDIVLRLNPQILIVEEAAEILESHIVTSLAPKTQHVILIGDHQQLRPSPTVHALAVNYDLNISLFERMVKNNMECCRLSVQHRMRPEVADLIVPHIYSDLKNHEVVTKYENIKGMSKNVFFVTHNYSELQEVDSKSKVNEHEAKFIIKLCKYLILQGYDPSKISVLTTYTGQLYVLKKLITNVVQKVRFTVVDNFQGEENDIILISFVRSNVEGDIGFLKISNRVCVALSRAKKGLYCIGNFELLAEKSDLWKNIVSTLNQKQAIGPSLQLMCQNHPGVSNVVAHEKDFDSVPEGGCSRVCEYRLTCGHVCSLMCHPYDSAHEFTRCHKECNKTCDEGHKCRKKCYQKCGKCTFLVDKKIYSCGHTIKVNCHMQNEDVKCFEKCKKLLSCGHYCSNKCSEKCEMICKKMTKVESPICGHELEIECCFINQPDKLIEKCRHPCKAILECDHVCKGNCSRCHQGRMHRACNDPCKRILVCGHECKSPCSKSCPPCKLPCENRCSHSRCPKKCGEPCDKCSELCEWLCRHKKCSRICGDICNRVPCNEPCPLLLPCRHKCIGFCGEPCPEECRECNSEVVKAILFGTEDDEDARFVCLEDCKHTLEISGLTEWLKDDTEANAQIQMKTCPRCKTVIRTNLRFGDTVKNCLRKIEKVKEITYGNTVKNMEMQKTLFKQVKRNSLLFKDIKDAVPIFNTWIKVLSSPRSRSIQDITTIDNTFNSFLKLISTLKYLENFVFHPYIEQSTLVKEGINVLSNFMKDSKTWMLNFIQDEYLTASEQQLQQLTWEIHRLSLGTKLLKFVQERTIKTPFSDFEKCISCLINYTPFVESDQKVFSASFQSLAQNCGSAVINVSDLEKESILKAMDLSKGHWYQCPNGHVYCITECGGAMQESKCNECNATIGGTNHALLTTNRVATDMDGARHSVWSDTVNIENYLLDFDL